MKRNLFLLATIFLAPQMCLTQERTPPAACSEAALAAIRPLPKLEYECPEGLADYDEKILKLPARSAAIRQIVGELEGFTNAAWWRVSVSELSACEIHAGAGKLTEDEKAQWRNGEYLFTLFGNQEMRVVLISDPCYQAGYGGSNAFLLYRNSNRVVVTQVLNGYFSRVDNSVVVNFAQLNGQPIIEVATSNSLPPSLLSYFFAIDSNGHAVPLRIFRDGRKFTNQIYSAMLMNEPTGLGLPRDATELNIIHSGRLARTFSAYEESERGKIDVDGRKLRRIVYRWNVKFYAPVVH